MSQINAEVRLRPIRFGFLVRPDDGERLQTIFEVNTCLWGGMYNPIIPYLDDVADWWERDGFRLETAREIVDGYLDFFEPDFLVEAEAGLGSGLGFEEGRVLRLQDILARSGEWDRRGHGLSVYELYQHLYQTDFQFAHRHEHNIVAPVAEQEYAALSACIFGAFPRDEGLQYLGRAFSDIFEPRQVPLTGAELGNLYRSGFNTALSLGLSEVDVQYHDHQHPALFVLDAQQPRDLLDFWNLRAVRRTVIPVPVQWAGDLSPFCREFITRTFRPVAGNPHGVMVRARVIFARSILSADIDRLHTEHFQVDVNANVIQPWYPPLWRPSPSYTLREMRPTLSAEQKTFDSPVTGERMEVRFEGLAPEFAEQFGNENRWANVVRIHDWTGTDQVATAFPCDYRKVMVPHIRMGITQPLATTEGLVITLESRNAPEYWQLPDGTTAITTWLQAGGIRASISDAGRAMQQVIHTLGAFTAFPALRMRRS